MYLSISCKRLNGGGSREEAEGARDVGDGAESGVTAHFPLEFRVARAGGFSVAGGVDGSFLGEDAGDFQFPGFFPQR